LTDSPVPHPDTGTRLAIERTWLAHERTLMAWVRTATALISFGFTIYKFFEFERAREGAVNGRLLTPRQFGMIMIGTGLIALVLATIQHRQSVAQMRAAGLGVTQRSVAFVVAVIVSAMGGLALVAALFRG
jgi:putative membrane protein